MVGRLVVPALDDGALLSPSPKRRWTVWTVWLVLVVCLAGSVGAAATWRALVTEQWRRAFEVTAADVGASVAAELRRDTDFVAAIQALVATRPAIDNAEFGAWVNAAGTTARYRYPGGAGFGFIASVPWQNLGTFAREIQADPPFTARGTTRLRLVPGGRREQYCLLRLVVTASPRLIPMGLDACAEGLPGLLTPAAARRLPLVGDTGEFAVTPLEDHPGVFSVTAPVFRCAVAAATAQEQGAVAAATAQEQRGELIGWVVGTVDGNAVLAASRQAHDNLNIQLIHLSPGEQPVVLARDGLELRDGWQKVIPVSAQGAWEVRVAGTGDPVSPSPELQFWLVLAAGLVFSTMLLGFIRLLAVGQVQAQRMVDRKTEELRRLALRDPLTGLANRALLMKLVDAALVRNRQQGTPLAMMFLDLDGFKGINDRYGHAAGDDLLRQVGRRLATQVQGVGAVGRLGGDEFVVLIESARSAARLTEIAERIRASLAEPFLLEGSAPETVTTHASIGIAVGPRTCADELLDDADAAMYEAKSSGKNRVVLHGPRQLGGYRRQGDHRDARAGSLVTGPAPS
jgi:diguanylate cyclase (GGDEF)-like protein